MLKIHITPLYFDWDQASKNKTAAPCLAAVLYRVIVGFKRRTRMIDRVHSAAILFRRDAIEG